jgi:hypothetical protein
MRDLLVEARVGQREHVAHGDGSLCRSWVSPMRPREARRGFANPSRRGNGQTRRDGRIRAPATSTHGAPRS